MVATAAIIVNSNETIHGTRSNTSNNSTSKIVIMIMLLFQYLYIGSL